MDAVSGSLGQLLSRLMRARGWSARALAREANIAQSTVSRWLRDERLPEADVLEAALDALGAGPEQRIEAFSHIETPRSLAHERAGVADALGDQVSMPGCGDLWRALRQRRGWTEREVAAALGVSVPTVSRWETGASRVPHDQAPRLCELLSALPEEQSWLCADHVYLPDPLADQDRSAAAYEERLRSIRATCDQWARAPVDLAMLSLIASMCEAARHDAATRHVLVDGLAVYGGFLADHLRPAAAIERGQAAWALARDVSASGDRLRHANWAYAHGLASAGRFREAASVRRRVLRPNAISSADALILLDLGRYHVELGEHEAGLGYLRLADRVYRAVGDSVGSHNARWQTGSSYIEQCRWREALAALPEPDGGSPNLGFHCHIAWSDALRGVGDLAGASDHLRACEALMVAHPGLGCHRPTLDAAWRLLLGQD